jgi:hypothetical protein
MTVFDPNNYPLRSRKLASLIFWFLMTRSGELYQVHLGILPALLERRVDMPLSIPVTKVETLKYMNTSYKKTKVSKKCPKYDIDGEAFKHLFHFLL